MPVRFAQVDRDHVGIAREVFEQEFQLGAQVFARRSFGERLQRVKESVPEPFEDAVEDLVLAVEVEVHAPRADPCLGGDRGDLGAVEAIACENADGGIQNARVLVAFLLAQSHSFRTIEY